jgi:hypothetical protein
MYLATLIIYLAALIGRLLSLTNDHALHMGRIMGR